MANRNKSQNPPRQPRRDGIYQARVEDPYRESGKYPEPTVCPDCGAVFHKGRWQWGEAEAEAQSHRCPACSRIHDRVPAAILTLSGDFYQTHRDEITNLINNLAEKEKAEHPLERIMDMESGEAEGHTVIRLTGVHLARGIGEALHHAYQGEFEFRYAEKDGVMHAAWNRQGG